MSAIQQYIDLYLENREAIDSHSAGALNALRPAALAALAGRDLPDRGEEGFEKTSVRDMFAPDFGVNVNRVDVPVDLAAAFRCDVPNVSTLLGVVVNDSFVPTASLHANLPAGLTVCSLAEAARTMPRLVDRFYGRAASLDSPGTALNTLLAQDGVFIHVAPGVKVAKPVQIVNIFKAAAPLMGVRRVLVVADEGSEVSILQCDHVQSPSVPFLSSQVVEIFAERGASVEFYDLEESSLSTSRYSQVYGLQSADSSVLVNGMTLTNGTTRNEYRLTTAEEGCTTHLYGLAIGSDTQHIDNESDMLHRAGYAHSRQLFKYVLQDQASGAFEGGIEVCPGAQKVEAYQSNRNVLVSPDARMHTKPQLLIYNDDVKCSHGASTGQLDQHAIFYMQTRGIPAATARMLLMQAFMVDIVDSVRIESFRDRLRHLVEKRLSGERASCADCSAICSAPKSAPDSAPIP